jgi:hypothetical protein
MIICLHTAQANMFMNQDRFEVDMSFQRLERDDIREVTFAGLIQPEGKSKLSNLLSNRLTNKYPI